MYKNILDDERSIELKNLLRGLRQDYKLSYKEILDFLVKDIKIPLDIFNKNLSSLETISKYCIENLGLNQKTIALLTNRSQKTIWQAYNSAKRKYPGKFILKSRKNFPLSVLQNRKLSVLESIVLHLKDFLKLSYHQISKLLKRDYKTIWTVYNRAIKK